MLKLDQTLECRKNDLLNYLENKTEFSVTDISEFEILDDRYRDFLDNKSYESFFATVKEDDGDYYVFITKQPEKNIVIFSDHEEEQHPLFYNVLFNGQNDVRDAYENEEVFSLLRDYVTSVVSTRANHNAAIKLLNNVVEKGQFSKFKLLMKQAMKKQTDSPLYNFVMQPEVGNPSYDEVKRNEVYDQLKAQFQKDGVTLKPITNGNEGKTLRAFHTLMTLLLNYRPFSAAIDKLANKR